MNVLRITAISSLVLTLAACGGIDTRDGPGRERQAAQAKPAVPKTEPLSKYGNPESYVVFGKRYYTLKTAAGFKESGVASWYGKKFHGRKTSSGEIYDMYKMTAAHKHLPLPTYVRVRNLETGKEITVRVNDRGPFHGNRVIDLSYAAASKLGILERGTGKVEITTIDGRQPSFAKPKESAQSPQLAAPIEKPLEKAVESVAQEILSDEVGLERVVASEIAPLIQQTVPQAASDMYLQVAAFREFGNAQIALEKIVEYIPLARIHEAVSSGTPLYRVQIGPISDMQQADNYMAQLAALGFAEHHFVSP